ncbi:hypothetical protein T4D_2846 [Trichinella pseudospiralis]|uniref:Uncharacterized protein n=1 Tax=Trichinella pseudospiralis TaxID=6337 RepID=A0A0V1FIC9_TRIPS|nr:hypothetical protein T4D_2846 [Trichinella pseudospiralis]
MPVALPIIDFNNKLQCMFGNMQMKQNQIDELFIHCDCGQHNKQNMLKLKTRKTRFINAVSFDRKE